MGDYNAGITLAVVLRDSTQGAARLRAHPHLTLAVHYL